jgi:hypothetical protein
LGRVTCICCRPASAGDPPLLLTRLCCWAVNPGTHRTTGYPCINTNISFCINTKRQRYPIFGCPYYLSRQIQSDPASRAIRPPERSGLPSDPASRAIRPPYSKNFPTFVLGWDLHIRRHCQNAELVIGCFVETLKRRKER